MAWLKPFGTHPSLACILWMIFSSSSALTSRTPKDDRDTFQDLPVADHLFMGIVCVDISGLTSTPKSLNDVSGAIGKSWSDFLAYLDLLSFEERPISIVLECVDNLNHNRAVQGRIEKGTLLAIEALRECLKSRRCTMDDLWRYAKICRVQNVIRPYLESLAL